MIISTGSNGVTLIKDINNSSFECSKMIISASMCPEQITLYTKESVKEFYIIFGYLKICFESDKAAVEIFNRISTIFE